MRSSSLGGGRILRRTLSVCLSVRPVIALSLPSVTSRHLANYNDTQCTFQNAQRAAYRTAISAAQACLIYSACFFSLCMMRSVIVIINKRIYDDDDDDDDDDDVCHC